MAVIYSFGIRLYGFAIHLASLFNSKAKLWVEGRKDLWSKLPTVAHKEVVWFHCASLGEFDQGLPVMNLLKARKPDCFILVTFFSPSGFLHYHKRNHPADYACYLPLDTKVNARRFVNHFKPKQALFVKYEFWSNYIFQLKQNQSKIYSISTLLNSKHRFFKWYGGYFRKTLHQFDYFFVQNQETQKLLSSINIKNTMITGDNRYDRVLENKKQLRIDEKLKAFVGGSDSVFIIGSSWSMDESVVLPELIKSSFEKIIIAPHSIDEAHVLKIQKLIRSTSARYTQLENDFTAKVLILDTIGHLASCYALGTVAYVGGGFSGSLHNILEPAVFGLPVLFGPKHKRFPEATAFIDHGFGFSISSKEEFSVALNLITQNLEYLSKKASDYVESNKGASQKIIDVIFNDI